jgi:hypothetical protein
MKTEHREQQERLRVMQVVCDFHSCWFYSLLDLAKWNLVSLQWLTGAPKFDHSVAPTGG